MIPLRLNIRNFLCYRENVPELDFAGLHVACLCGSNGHGKSALLDAITWSLWGKARGKTQDDLISYGADESRVELEFSARDTRYRVIRSHARGGARRRSGVSDLQLQLLDGEAAQPISGNSLRETQAKIEQIVGMDYDTFINSAFLLQGRADEFTNKTPADRKAVLSSILGLDIYDRIQAQARERANEKKTDVDRLEGSFSQIQREIEEIGDPQEELGGVNVYLDNINRQLGEKRAEVESIRNQVARLEGQRNELADLQRQMLNHQREIKQLESGIAASQSRIAEFQSLIEQSEEIRQGMEQLEQARRQYESLERDRQAADSLGQEQGRLTQVIARHRVRLESEVDHLRQTIERELTPKAKSEAALHEKLSESRQAQEQLTTEEQKIARKRQQLQTVATGIGEAQTTAERYEVEGAELASKLELLNRSDNDQAVCPLCQTPLSEDGCQRLADTYEAEIQQKRDLYRQNRSLLQQLEAEKSELEQEMPRLEEALARQQSQLQVTISDLERQIRESQQAQRELEESSPRLAAALASLESGEFAVEEHRQLQEVEQQFGTLSYDDAARQQCYHLMQELQTYTDQHNRLTNALESLPREEQTRTQSQEMLERRRTELVEQQDRHRTGEAAIADLPSLEQQLVAQEAALAEVESSQSSVLARRGYLEGQLRRLSDLRQEVESSSRQVSALQEEQGIYQELATAFGRQGVQAMLIETVVPRLEEEANLLLGRMTDNRMHVKLETQRERRTGRGEPIETLEINVSDELGLRAYEMFSGGEAFRVNLALRIALSKVLSQRMGAPLPTLFIDEGFGTQDAAGRDRIMDVISAIQEDFEKIIVITHLDDMKDMFPARIEVQKDGNGSTFWLN
ncbi:MAG: AAA family ATPase [Dehalococcoidia bacterium]